MVNRKKGKKSEIVLTMSDFENVNELVNKLMSGLDNNESVILSKEEAVEVHLKMLKRLEQRNTENYIY